MSSRRLARRARGPALRPIAVVALVVAIAGCLGDASEPTPRSPAASAPRRPSAAPTADTGTLRFVLESEPAGFVPLAEDAPGQRIVQLVHEPLYRLDARLSPRPALAEGLPSVSADRRTWTIALRPGAVFHDRTPVTADDALLALSLARSPNCPYGEDVCRTASSAIGAVNATSPSALSLVLLQPHAPLLTIVLARVPVLPADAVRASLARLERAAASVDPDAPGALVERIAAAANAEECVAANVPPSCRLQTYAAELEGLLRRAGVEPPVAERFTTALAPDEERAAVMLEQLQLLVAALDAEGTDRLAAAYALLDVHERPVGAGPFAFSAYRPGESVELIRHAGYHLAAPAIERIRAVVVTDPSAAATALRTGDVDWLPNVAPDQVAALGAASEVRLGPRAEFAYRAVIFNVRPGRIYAEVETRQAFALCLAKAPIVEAATGGRALPAWTPVVPRSWAAAEQQAVPAAPARAFALLEAAGWTRSADGVFTRGDRRLSSEVSVRPSRTDLVAFMRTASEQLRGCGIELLVRERELSGEELLAELQWPNDFDTTVVTQPLGFDPSEDLAPYLGSRVTTEANPGDLNVGGWSSPEFNRLYAAARAEPAPARRTTLYQQMHAILAREVPAYPLWYETSFGAVSRRVTAANGDVDLANPVPASDVASWTLAQR